MRNFFSRKLSVAGLCVFVCLFLACFILPVFYPSDVSHTDSTRMNLPPGLNYLAIPKALSGNLETLSFGPTFGAGLDTQGNLYPWGTLTGKLSAAPPNGMGPLKLVSCGLDHIAAVSRDNRVYAWGNDRLGITDIPETVQGRNIVDLQAGYQVTLVLDDTGTLHFWGNDRNFSLSLRGHERSVAAFALNISTVIALTHDGGVVCLTAKDMPFSRVPEAAQGRAVAVASTDSVAAAVLDDGTVLTWGLSDAEAIHVPEEIQGRVVSLKGGRAHFTALLDDGSVLAWGENDYTQANAPALTGTAAIYAGYYQNAAVHENGQIAAWGQRGCLMGTDQWGRDVFVRLLQGGRITLTVGFISVLISGLIGVLIGGLAGYLGGRTDMLLMRLGEIVSSLPFIPLAVLLAAIVSNQVSETMRVVMIMAILGFLGWPDIARLTRAQVLSEKKNEFITAAKAMGAREGTILFRHILPNVSAVVLVSLTLSMATCLLLEASLSFLGFGILEPTPTWGNMLNKCVDSGVIQNYWWRWVFPSLALSLCTISINIAGDGFRGAIDPKS